MDIDVPVDSKRPTYFELFAQDKIRDLLKPALQYSLSLYAPTNPRLILPLLNWSDELYSAFMFVIEWYYLNEWEFLYALKRQPAGMHTKTDTSTDSTIKSLRISPAQRVASLVVLVCIPYLQVKIEEKYKKMSEFMERNEEFQSSSADDRSNLTRHFTKLYPKLKQLLRYTHYMYRILFLIGISRYFNPVNHLMGIKISRIEAQDYANREEENAAALDSIHQNCTGLDWRTRVLGLIKLLFYKSKSSIKHIVPTIFIVLRFLEWWNASDFPKQTRQKPIPPPPEPLPIQKNGVKLPVDKKECPLCCKPIINPTMLPSGYVFCYPCIFDYTSKYSKCPITFMNVTSELRRLYE